MPVTAIIDEIPDIPEIMRQMAVSIQKSAALLNTSESSAFFHMLLTAKRVYVAGACRSRVICPGICYETDAYLGVDAYIVGETITLAMQTGDGLVVFSGSGRSNSMVSVCETAKSFGGETLTYDRIA